MRRTSVIPPQGPLATPNRLNPQRATPFRLELTVPHAAVRAVLGDDRGRRLPIAGVGCGHGRHPRTRPASMRSGPTWLDWGGAALSLALHALRPGVRALDGLRSSDQALGCAALIDAS